MKLQHTKQKNMFLQPRPQEEERIQTKTELQDLHVGDVEPMVVASKADDAVVKIIREAVAEVRMKVICKNLMKKCIEFFQEIAKNKEYYTKFYEAFSMKIKLGIHKDSTNKTKLAELFRYHSFQSGDQMTSLKDFLTRIKDGENDIYYITGESKKAVGNSQFLEKVTAKGELVDAIHEYVVRYLKEIEGKKLVSAAKIQLELQEAEDKQQNHDSHKEKFEESSVIYLEPLMLQLHYRLLLVYRLFLALHMSWNTRVTNFSHHLEDKVNLWGPGIVMHPFQSNILDKGNTGNPTIKSI